MMVALLTEAQGLLPLIAHPEQAARGLEAWTARLGSLEDPEAAAAADLIAEPRARGFLEAIFGNSPFLTDCLLGDPGYATRLFLAGPDTVLREVMTRLKSDLPGCRDRETLAAGLRRARREVALAVALADIAGIWPLERQCEALSELADGALDAALSHLLRAAAERGDLVPAEPGAPLKDCGITILGLGKLGARELNYSSDIDLIVLFDPERMDYRHGRGIQEGCVRLTRDLVRLLEERRGDGYVFRVDLRLRPDPGAMPVAISTVAALTYYESMGQNWERAAMIKARPSAGDRQLGDAFLTELRPFVWRKSLDFLALQDIHSIKRQIHAHKGGATIAVAGHDIKLGRGGIREIELFAQTQQLIWGGREPRLRSKRTLEALEALAAVGRVTGEAARDLAAAYRYLRRLEHRLQMVDDQQTQKLPPDEAGIAELARFLGHETAAEFREALLGVLHVVEDHYAELFEEAPQLTQEGNLVFTGGEPEPGTLATLSEIGFSDGTKVFNLVRAWHHGRHRATRSTRARELLTELMPELLGALGRTTQPDLALSKFDEFLGGLPAGVQLFALLQANPSLLELLAEIMGGAPALADRLSRKPALLDAVLTPGFFGPLPGAAELAHEYDEALSQARGFEEVLDLSRRWANDHHFQIGLHILRHKSKLEETSRALSDIADTVIRGYYAPVGEELARAHGHIPGGDAAILALGKLGAREMTVSSDLDLIFLYQAPETTTPSDGAKPLAASQYYARFAQRYINALSALTAEGSLYEIDMRLRPSGNAGPIATTVESYLRYYERDAWTWEHMALSRARVVAGSEALRGRIEAGIAEILRRPRDPDRLLVDVAEMRARIERERSAKTIWSVKFLRGGLTDLEFLAQYLLLRHAHDHPEIIDRSTQAVFAKLARAGLLGSTLAQRLIEATRLVRQVQGMLRLTCGPAFNADEGTPSLQAALARSAGLADFVTLRQRLIATAAEVYEVFIEIVEEPARAARARLEAQEEDAKASSS